jgi:hypothetical protein
MILKFGTILTALLPAFQLKAEEAIQALSWMEARGVIDLTSLPLYPCRELNIQSPMEICRAAEIGGLVIEYRLENRNPGRLALWVENVNEAIVETNGKVFFYELLLGGTTKENAPSVRNTFCVSTDLGARGFAWNGISYKKFPPAKENCPIPTN